MFKTPFRVFVVLIVSLIIIQIIFGIFMGLYSRPVYFFFLLISLCEIVLLHIPFVPHGYDRWSKIHLAFIKANQRLREYWKAGYLS